MKFSSGGLSRGMRIILTLPLLSTMVVASVVVFLPLLSTMVVASVVVFVRQVAHFFLSTTARLAPYTFHIFFPLISSDQIQLRWVFTRNVYFILTLQLLFTIGVASIVVFVRQVVHFFLSTPARLALYIFHIFFPLILIWPMDYWSAFTVSVSEFLSAKPPLDPVAFRQGLATFNGLQCITNNLISNYTTIIADAESSSYEGLLASYEELNSAVTVKSVQLGFAGMNMISKVALDQPLSHFVWLLFGHLVATLILDRLERSGIISLAGEAKVLGAIIFVGRAVLVTLCKEITINLWSSPILLKEGNTSTDDKSPLFWGFISQLARPLRWLMLQQKGSVYLGLRLGNSRGRTALIMFLLMMNIAVTSKAAAVTVDNTVKNRYLIDNTVTTFAGEAVPVVDKLPPNCHYVDKCRGCFPCKRMGKGFQCCES